MSDILKTIADYTRLRIEKQKEEIGLEQMKEIAKQTKSGEPFAFEKALCKSGISFICECKKASPSKGIIAQSFPYLEIAKEYELAGASAVSVLTEPKWFLGKDEYLSEISKAIQIPCLRKDFTVDEYMIYQAKALGASAVLLICSLLDKSTLERYINIADSLNLSALVEAHDENEIKDALNAGARIIGVNNRNLKNFSVDPSNSLKLRSLVGSKAIFVSESGIKTPQDVELLKKNGVDAVLIGETLMKAKDKKQMLLSLGGEEK